MDGEIDETLKNTVRFKITPKIGFSQKYVKLTLSKDNVIFDVDLKKLNRNFTTLYANLTTHINLHQYSDFSGSQDMVDFAEYMAYPFSTAGYMIKWTVGCKYFLKLF